MTRNPTQRDVVWYTVRELATGQRIASTCFDDPISQRWGWIAAVVAAWFAVRPDDVGIRETDDGDVITICGAPAAVEEWKIVQR